MAMSKCKSKAKMGRPAAGNKMLSITVNTALRMRNVRILCKRAFR